MMFNCQKAVFLYYINTGVESKDIKKIINFFSPDIVPDHPAEIPGHLPLQLEGDAAGHAGHVVLVVEKSRDIAHCNQTS